MIEVAAVKDKAMVKRIENLLRDKSDIYGDVWAIGLNMALRISDLLSLTFSDVTGERVAIAEGKTGKKRIIKITPSARAIIEKRRAANPEHVYLFQSASNRSKALGKPITRFAVAKAFKEVGERNSVQVNIGTHSMRKTRGYFMHSAGVPIERIAAMLNHSSPATTMRYIGLDQEVLDKDYDDFDL
ncbi:tyrosine-type recombinase/integrase [Oceanisphaera sp. IT1-181]|uniref:tyrosine-type recombinase/integrase n=1 Tax=Oceanisphaera sp. IT1-181 TaxID=3081199 RepID=UPI0029CA9B3F|nr:tyrosine-type recombinase/integrase [Oceanisphaera sp. IT1-181]